MRLILVVSAIGLLFGTLQTPAVPEPHPLSGTWRVEGEGRPFPWEVYLRVADGRLAGRVSNCTSPAVDIEEGILAGEQFSFRCSSLGDRDRSIAFVGMRRGDEISLRWTLHVRPGGAPPIAANLRLFGPDKPPVIVARRVADGPLAASFNAVRTPAREIVAAVNLLEQNVKASAKVLLSRKATDVRALIAVMDYGRGEDFYGESPVRALADTAGAAVALIQVSGIETPIRPVPPAGTATNNAILAVLHRAAEEAGVAELAKVPIVLWAHSAAGPAASAFATDHPDRTAGTVRYQTADAGLNSTILSKVPGLFIRAEKENDGGAGTAAVRNIVRAARTENAPWTFVVSPGSSHGDIDALRRDVPLMASWVAAIIEAAADPLMRDTRRHTGTWVGMPETATIVELNQFRGPIAESIWLPDEATARAWHTLATGRR